MSTILTQKEALVLSKLSYMNFKDDDKRDYTAEGLKGKSLLEIATKYCDERDSVKEFGGYGGLSDTEQLAMLKEIKDGKYYATTTDTVEFGAGITLSDLELFIDACSLRINIKGTTDTLIIQNWINGDSYKVDQFECTQFAAADGYDCFCNTVTTI